MLAERRGNAPYSERPEKILQLAKDIAALPAGVPKVKAANTLAHIAMQGDTGNDALQATADTLAQSLKDTPQPVEKDGLAAQPYIHLARIERYTVTKTSLNDPMLAKADDIVTANHADAAKADFTLKDLNGKKVTLSALHGKIVLINFWAIQCVPCKQEMQDLDLVYRTTSSKDWWFCRSPARIHSVDATWRRRDTIRQFCSTMEARLARRFTWSSFTPRAMPGPLSSIAMGSWLLSPSARLRNASSSTCWERPGLSPTNELAGGDFRRNGVMERDDDSQRRRAGCAEDKRKGKAGMDGAGADAGDGADAHCAGDGAAGGGERVFEASLTELEGVGLPARAAQFVFEGRAFEAAEDEAKRVAEAGGSF